MSALIMALEWSPAQRLNEDWPPSPRLFALTALAEGPGRRNSLRVVRSEWHSSALVCFLQTVTRPDAAVARQLGFGRCFLLHSSSLHRVLGGGRGEWSEMEWVGIGVLSPHVSFAR